MDRVYVLQSGFVTMAPESLVKTSEPNLTFKDSLYVLDYRVQDTDNYYDEEIETLFQSFRKNNELLRRFEFREAILRAAYRVFKSDTIVPWLRLQLSQRTVGYLHRQFLKETFQKVSGGSKRNTDCFQYYRLLSAGEMSRHMPQTQKDPQPLLEEYVRIGKSTLLSDLLLEWTPDMEGVSDLLSSLHVIFGCRHGSSSVAMN